MDDDDSDEDAQSIYRNNRSSIRVSALEGRTRPEICGKILREQTTKHTNVCDYLSHISGSIRARHYKDDAWTRRLPNPSVLLKLFPITF